MTVRTGYRVWRTIHISASTILVLIAAAHIAMTWFIYSTWSPNAVWFLGTGLALLLVGLLNLSHVGLEPCVMPTTRLVRWTLPGPV